LPKGSAGGRWQITALPELLRALELAGCIVTLDALHCQKSTAREIHEADADYVLALKGNQGTAHGEVRAFLDDAILRAAPHLVKMETVEKGHGRIEIRRSWQSGDIGWFADRAEWEALRSVGVVEAEREVAGSAPSTERRYYLSSLPPDIGRFARAVRGHWSVENQLHWSLDVSFGEDGSHARTRHAPPTSPPCAASPSTSSARTNPPPKASAENASAAPSFKTTSSRFSNFDASALASIHWRRARKWVVCAPGYPL
jgi:predicted transposase YbfD/YdcC